MAALVVANSSFTPLSFRTRLDQLADEHERVQARAARLTAENLRLKSLLGQPCDLSAEIPYPEISATSKDASLHFEGQVSPDLKDTSTIVAPMRVCPSEVDLDIALMPDPCGQVLSEGTPTACPGRLNSMNQSLIVEVQEEEGLRVAGTDIAEGNCMVADTASSTSERSHYSSQEERLTGRNYGSNASLESVFPHWFDPVLSDEESVEVSSALMNVQPLPSHCGTLSPQSGFRVSWDGLACICLMFELWFTPFQLVFDVPQVPRTFVAISYAITSFFALDIILNFFTGYIDGDTTVLQWRLIIKNYLKFWFWVDLIATIPYGLLLETDDEMVSVARQGKAFKIFKVLRLLKFLRAMRLMKIVKNMGTVARHAHLLEPVRKLLKFVGIQMFLILLAHVHGCIWAALQPDWAAASSMEEALKRYLHSLWWAYTSLTVGNLGVNPRSDSPMIWVLEMITASERIVWIVVALRRIFFESLTWKNDADHAAGQRDVLSLLRQHNVSFATQLKVLWSQDDMRNADLQQAHLHQLLNANLSDKLRKEVYHEMWNERLMSFGLIAHVASWHKGFIEELEQHISEAVFPSQKVIFQEGEAASAAYCIIRGLLHVTRSCKRLMITQFTAGMWVGENALVSTIMRRSATMESKGITVLLVLNGDDFQALISRCGLMQRYQQFCSDQLWRGVCGCCGAIGTHFSDSCEKALRETPVAWSAKRRQSWVCNRDLEQFLEVHGLFWLTGYLTSLGILSLDDMKHLDIQQLRACLSDNQILSPWDEDSLRIHNIMDYIQSRTAKTHESLFHEVSRLQHLMFLSHYKVEAGTEAALMHTELQQAIAEEPGSLGHNFDEPVFLDSENLNNLQELQERVSNTHNLVLLLTKGVLARPWVLVEIVTARREGLQIILVNVSKVGAEFVFPDDDFYARLRNGQYLGQEATEVLKQCGCSLQDTEAAIREIFHQIAVPYSPHKSMTIRQAEIRAVLKQCVLKTDVGGEGSTNRQNSARLRRQETRRIVQRCNTKRGIGNSSSSTSSTRWNKLGSEGTQAITMNDSQQMIKEAKASSSRLL